MSLQDIYTPPLDLHDEAMDIAYDDNDEWQGDCPNGYKANLLANRIEELVQRALRADRAAERAALEGLERWSGAEIAGDMVIDQRAQVWVYLKDVLALLRASAKESK